MFDVAEKPIVELRAALDAGETTAVELVHAYRERIARYDRPTAGSPAGPLPGAAGEQAADRAAGTPAASGISAGGVSDDAAPDGGVPLNSVVVDNPRALEEARASDERRAAGAVLGPLDGIPYTAKNSFMVAGLTVAAGSPAVAGLVAQWDAFTIERLRAAGAVLLGLTNMPPMANGGMQRGLYGRAESPYNADFLTSAFASGSSNGSGTATAASFAAFGLGEETWSSGRAPASCNALCAYTPSRGIISVRGNWPLVPTMDVVVPHTRTMADLLEVLNVIVADDHTARGDFWRVQPWITVPAASAVRPVSYPAVADDAEGRDGGQAGDDQPDGQPGPRSTRASPRSPLAGFRSTRASLRSPLVGTRLGVPRMYINADPDAGTGPVADAGYTAAPGIGGPMGRRIQTRESVIALWESARDDLEAAGAIVVEVDFPVVSRYEGDRLGAPTVSTRGFVSAEYLQIEVTELAAWAWEDFLQANGDPRLHTLAQVDGTRISLHPPGALADRYHGFDDDLAAFPDLMRAGGLRELTGLPGLAGGLAGLERTRQADLEDWMDELALDAVLFPALADVGPADADVNPVSAELAWRNGVWVANGNLVPRHLGIPTVTVPMGTAADIGMPFGLTFAGRAYDDTTLLRLACAYEATGRRRTPPPRTTPPATTLSGPVHDRPRSHPLPDPAHLPTYLPTHPPADPVTDPLMEEAS